MSKTWILKFYDLEIQTILGVYDHEKVKKKYFLDIEIEFMLGESYRSDDIKDTIDTWRITKVIQEYVFEKNYDLLECITYDIVQLVLWFDNIISINATTYKDIYSKIRRVWFSYIEKKVILKP